MRERILTTYDPQQVGKLIRHMRTVAGLTQDTLAEGLQKNRASIANMERGAHTISLADLMRAAQLCGFDLRLVASRHAK